MAFLEVLTRCYRRPTWLAENQASMAAQTDPDYVQTLLVDDVGVGVPAANARLAQQAGKLTGDYIWALDDDDLCICDDLIERLKGIVERFNRPAAIVVRMDHGELGILPDVYSPRWGKVPREGEIGGSAIIARRDIWNLYADRWATARYASDWDFAAAILQQEEHIVWLNLVASRIRRRSIGQPEVL